MKLLEKILQNKLYAIEKSFTRRINLCFQPDSFADFNEHDEFEVIFKKFTNGDSYRGMDIARLWSVALNIKHVLSAINGSIVELGVYKGHMASVLSYYAESKARKLYLIDTFTGFSEDQLEHGMDSSKAKAFEDTNLERAREVVGDYENNIWLVGTFPDCITEQLNNESFAFVSLDCDLYTPIKLGLEFFWPKLNSGGMIFVHDYSSGHWSGCTQAVDEFMKINKIFGVQLPDKSGSLVLIKP